MASILERTDVLYTINTIDLECSFMSHNSQFSEMNSIERATSVALLQNCSKLQFKMRHIKANIFVADFICYVFDLLRLDCVCFIGVLNDPNMFQERKYAL